MKIGLAQMNSQDDKSNNLSQAEKMIDELSAQGAKLIILPEYFNYLGPEENWPDHAETLENSESLGVIRGKAMAKNVAIHCGSIMEREGEKIFNTGIVFDGTGQIICQYRKIHLFDVNVPGGRRYFESETITPGDSIATFTLDNITFGMATCYDLRFPELFRIMVKKGVQVILLPAAFTLMTGKDHWELLLRARAVENLCWVAAAAQFGACPPNHMSYGHSMIVDPWGIVTAQAGDCVSTVVGEIHIDHLQEIRKNFPALTHMRL